MMVMGKQFLLLKCTAKGNHLRINHTPIRSILVTQRNHISLFKTNPQNFTITNLTTRLTQHRHFSFQTARNFSSNSKTTHSNGNKGAEKKKEEDFFLGRDKLKRRQNDEEEEILFIVDKRRWFVMIAILAFVQLVFCVIASNVFFNFAQQRIEKENKEKKEEELEILKSIEGSDKLKERSKTDQKLVSDRIKQLEEEIEMYSKKKYQLSSWQLLKRFEFSDHFKVFLPVIFSALCFAVIRTLGYYAVRQIDLLPGSKQVRIGTYRFFGHPHNEVYPINQLQYQSSNDKFVFVKLPNLKMFAVSINIKEGTIFNPEKFSKVIKGIEPKIVEEKGAKGVQSVVNKFLQK